MEDDVIFDKIGDGKYLVEYQGKKYGVLAWDYSQSAWVLWPDDIDDGISYGDDMKDAYGEIVYELTHQDD